MGHASAILTLFVFAGTLGAQQATIREEPQVIKSYPFSGPNPSPTRPGGQNVQQRIYPYFLFDELTSTGADRTWNVVRMENPYIEAFVLPAVGGKLIGAIEKSTKNAFIYQNHVLKFRNIAMRGPWTSGGIEANFGIMGHAPSTATPVRLPGAQQPGRQRQLLHRRDGPSIPDGMARRVPHPAR